MSAKRKARAAWWANRVKSGVPTDAERRRARLAERAAGGDWRDQMMAGGYVNRPVSVRYPDRDSYTGEFTETVERPSMKDRLGGSIVCAAPAVTRRQPREESRARKSRTIEYAWRRTPAHLRGLPDPDGHRAHIAHPMTWVSPKGEVRTIE